MVLLKGLNYDFSGQVSSFLSTAATAADTILTVISSVGLSDADYIVINANTEYAEIVKITTVDSVTQLTVSALTQSHSINVRFYRLPYNQVKFYECAVVGGTYTVVASGTVDMDYSQLDTNFAYPAGDDAYFFKRTFLNETTAVESDIALSTYWQTDDEQYLITADEMRRFLQFDENDYPTKEDYNFFINLASSQFAIDSNTLTGNFARIAMFFLTKWYVMRGLATRSLSKGYITVNAEGRNITKATQELVLEAENTLSEYKSWLTANDRTEAICTKYMDNRDLVSAETANKIIDIFNGTQNAMDFQQDYGRKRRIGE